MRLTLGDATNDLATRSLVFGVLDLGASPLAALCRQAEGLVAAGADLVEFRINEPVTDVRRVREAVVAVVKDVGVPAGIGAANPEATRAAIDAGAVLVGDEPAEVLSEAARAGVAVVAAVGEEPGGGHGSADRREALVRRARRAEAAGVPPGRIVVDPLLGQLPERLRQARRLAELGYPLLVEHESPAAIALAVIGGCRVVRTRDARTARRVCDVLAAILAARP